MFGTRLTRVTRLLRDKDRDRALARVADTVNDWAGGTRIGESFREFNQHWARRSLRTSGVVVVVSDGWDRGDPAIVAAETARLRRNCHRLVWLNPLAGTPGYQPLAGGMRAAFPYIDDFLPAGHGRQPRAPRRDPRWGPPADTRHGAEAAAHAAIPGSDADRSPARRRPPCRGPPADPTAAKAAAMKELLDTLAAWQGEGADVGRAVVVRTFGSAPRPEGAVLLYAADGRIAGSVSGGCVEGAAAEEIERARATGHARVIRYGISDEQAWDVGLACGGTIDVLVEPVRAEAAVTAATASIGAGGHGAAVVTPLPGDSPPADVRPHEPGRGSRPPSAARRPRRRPARGLARRSGAGRGAGRRPPAMRCAEGSSRTVELGGRSLFVEVFPVRPRLVVVGAVEVARFARPTRAASSASRRSSSTAAPRSRPTERFPDVDRLVVGWPDEVADEIGLGPERRRRRPDPRRQVRRAGDRRGAATRLPLRRRGRVAQDPGRSTRAAAGGRCHAPRNSPSCAVRSGSTSADARRPRRRSRSSPRSSPSGMAASGGRCEERVIA